jgi:hypothetical protein
MSNNTYKILSKKEVIGVNQGQMMIHYINLQFLLRKDNELRISRLNLKIFSYGPVTNYVFA